MKQNLRQIREQEEIFLDVNINIAEDIRTNMSKKDITNSKRATIEHSHKPSNKPTLILAQKGRTYSYWVGISLRRAIQHLRHDNQRVWFDTENSVTQLHRDAIADMMTYESGADGNYIREADRKRSRLPILQKQNKQVGVSNGGINKGQYVTKLPFQHLSETAVQSDTFNEFSMSLMRIGKNMQRK